tara:strand:- start:4283 stop:9826 length:5544 start_codon:yes stop_codon:yes gene_type:complete
MPKVSIPIEEKQNTSILTCNILYSGSFTKSKKFAYYIRSIRKDLHIFNKIIKNTDINIKKFKEDANIDAKNLPNAFSIKNTLDLKKSRLYNNDYKNVPDKVFIKMLDTMNLLPVTALENFIKDNLFQLFAFYQEDIKYVSKKLNINKKNALKKDNYSIINENKIMSFIEETFSNNKSFDFLIVLPLLNIAIDFNEIENHNLNKIKTAKKYSLDKVFDINKVNDFLKNDCPNSLNLIKNYIHIYNQINNNKNIENYDHFINTFFDSITLEHLSICTLEEDIMKVESISEDDYLSFKNNYKENTLSIKKELIKKEYSNISLSESNYILYLYNQIIYNLIIFMIFKNNIIKKNNSFKKLNKTEIKNIIIEINSEYDLNLISTKTTDSKHSSIINFKFNHLKNDYDLNQLELLYIDSLKKINYTKEKLKKLLDIIEKIDRKFAFNIFTLSKDKLSKLHGFLHKLDFNTQYTEFLKTDINNALKSIFEISYYLEIDGNDKTLSIINNTVKYKDISLVIESLDKLSNSIKNKYDKLTNKLTKELNQYNTKIDKYNKSIDIIKLNQKNCILPNILEPIDKSIKINDISKIIDNSNDYFRDINKNFINDNKINFTNINLSNFDNLIDISSKIETLNKSKKNTNNENQKIKEESNSKINELTNKKNYSSNLLNFLHQNKITNSSYKLLSIYTSFKNDMNKINSKEFMNEILTMNFKNNESIYILNKILKLLLERQLYKSNDALFILICIKIYSINKDKFLNNEIDTLIEMHSSGNFNLLNNLTKIKNILLGSKKLEIKKNRSDINQYTQDIELIFKINKQNISNTENTFIERTYYKTIKDHIKAMINYIYQNHYKKILNNSENDKVHILKSELEYFKNKFSSEDIWIKATSQSLSSFKNLETNIKQRLNDDFMIWRDSFINYISTLIQSFAKYDNFIFKESTDNVLYDNCLKFNESNLLNTLNELNIENYDKNDFLNDLAKNKTMILYNFELIDLLYSNRSKELTFDIICETFYKQLLEEDNGIYTFDDYNSKEILSSHITDTYKNNLDTSIINEYKNKIKYEKDSLTDLKNIFTNENHLKEYESYINSCRFKSSRELYKKIRHKQTTDDENDKKILAEMSENIKKEKANWEQKINNDHSNLSLQEKLKYSKYLSKIEPWISYIDNFLKIKNLEQIIYAEKLFDKIKDLSLYDLKLFNENPDDTLVDLKNVNIIADRTNLKKIQENIDQYPYLDMVKTTDLIHSYHSMLTSSGALFKLDKPAKEKDIKKFKNFIYEFCLYFNLITLKKKEKGDFENNESGCFLLKIDELNIPFVKTRFYDRLSNITKKEVIIVTIHQSQANKNNINALTGLLYDKLKSLKMVEYDQYDLFDLIIIETNYHNNNSKISKINKTREFNNVLLLNNNSIAKLLKTKRKEDDIHLLIHKLISNYNIVEINPFRSNSEVSKDNGIFIGRNIIINELLKPNNYNLYGGRRIGKSSICIELENILKIKGTVVYRETVQHVIGSHKDIKFNEGFNWAKRWYEKIGVDLSNTENFVDLYNKVNDFLLINKNNSYCIILDEFDQFINECDEFYKLNNFEPNYHILNHMRDLHKNCGNIRFILSGFMTLYNYINENTNVNLEFSKNPFVALGESRRLDLFNEDEARDLITTGLNEYLNLEFEDEYLIGDIVNKSGKHPAFIQNFCSKLVNEISPEITPNNRMITRNSVEQIFDSRSTDSFSKFVDEKTTLNIGVVGRSIVATMALHGDSTSAYSEDDIFNNLLSYINEINNVKIDLNQTIKKHLKQITEIMYVTGIIDKKSDKSNSNLTVISFVNKFWAEIKLVQYNQDDGKNEKFISDMEDAYKNEREGLKVLFNL